MNTELEPGQCDFLELVSIEKAHDVRTLRGCAHCGGLGHAYQMIEGTPFADTKGTPWFHGRCFAAKFGDDAILKLGKRDRDKLTLGDLGVRLMRSLVERK